MQNMHFMQHETLLTTYAGVFAERNQEGFLLLCLLSMQITLE